MIHLFPEQSWALFILITALFLRLTNMIGLFFKAYQLFLKTRSIYLLIFMVAIYSSYQLKSNPLLKVNNKFTLGAPSAFVLPPKM